MQELVPAVAIVTVSAVLAGVLIVLIRPLLVRYVVAQVNARSSHKMATPQGAGLAVMIALFAVLAAAYTWSPRLDEGPPLFPVLIAAAGLSLLGLADDARTLSVSWRLVGQALAALAVVAALPRDFRLLPELLPLLVERGLLVLGMMWFINAINFLDGIDLITVAEVLPMTAAIALLAFLGVLSPKLGLLALTLLGAMLGFAYFNWHPARVFLGDAGSLPIGLLLAFMLIMLARENLAAALILPLYTLIDATVTLVRRAFAGEAVWTAHKSHFYQRALGGGFSVPEVSGRVFLLGVLLACLAVVAAFASSPLLGLLLLGIGVLATCLLLASFAKGRG